MKTSKLGFGVVGSLPLDTVETIAINAERLGYQTIWFNETPAGDALLRVGRVQAATERLVAGIGVINLDTRPPAEILARMDELGVDPARLILGIGASRKPSPLSTVQSALETLTQALDCPVVVGSLGPRMRKLGAEAGDGLLFNWLPPMYAAETTSTLRSQAAAVGRPTPLAATYVRTALGPAAFMALETEAEKYSAIPSYAANFSRLGITAMDSAVFGADADVLIAGLARFDGTVDHLVVRAITASDEPGEYVRLLQAVAPLATNGATAGV